MKLLAKALIITSLSLAVATQVQAGGRHDGSGFAENQDVQHQRGQLVRTSHRDDRISHREKKIYRNRHGHTNNRAWRHRLNDRYRSNKHYWKNYDRPSHRYYYGRPGHRYNYDYGRSSGAIIFRW